jgi:hypothetical protein
MVLMGVNTLLGLLLTLLLTCKRKNPQTEGEKIVNQQHYEGKNPKNPFLKKIKFGRVLNFKK